MEKEKIIDGLVELMRGLPPEDVAEALRAARKRAAKPRAGEPTTTAEEALALLRKRRWFLVAMGKHIAAELAQKNGKVTSLDLRLEMSRRGLLENVGTGHWLGAVFADGDVLEWTGKLETVSSKEWNIHARPVKVWALRAGVALPPAPKLDDAPSFKKASAAARNPAPAKQAEPVAAEASPAKSLSVKESIELNKNVMALAHAAGIDPRIGSRVTTKGGTKGTVRRVSNGMIFFEEDGQPGALRPVWEENIAKLDPPSAP